MKIFKRYDVLCLLFFLIIQIGMSGQADISSIPDSVLSGATSVILDHQETLEILNKSQLKT